MHPISCSNTYHCVKDLVNDGMVKNTKLWISWEWNITFLRNEKILNLCRGWHILRCYRFIAEVTWQHRALLTTFRKSVLLSLMTLFLGIFLTGFCILHIFMPDFKQNILEEKRWWFFCFSFVFLIGIYSMQCWTTTTRHGVTWKRKKKAHKKINAYRKSV